MDAMNLNVLWVAEPVLMLAWANVCKGVLMPVCECK
jgi:hypothetical protein